MREDQSEESKYPGMIGSYHLYTLDKHYIINLLMSLLGKVIVRYAGAESVLDFFSRGFWLSNFLLINKCMDFSMKLLLHRSFRPS